MLLRSLVDEKMIRLIIVSLSLTALLVLNCDVEAESIVHGHYQHKLLQRGPLKHSHVLHPMSQTLGREVRMDCLAGGVNTSKSRLVWTKDSRLIRPDNINYRLLANGTLVIRHATLADSGSYHCLLVRSTPSYHGTTVPTMHGRQGGHIVGLQRPAPPGRYLNGTRLKILTDELIGNNLHFKTKPPPTLSVHLGGSIEIICEARLLPAPGQPTNQEILETWSRFNQAIESGTRIQLLDSGRLLSIQNIRPEDAGDYVCVAASTTGQIIAATTTLLIVPKPPDDVQVTEGSPTFFDCAQTPTSRDRNLEGVSSIEWAKDGQVIAALPDTWRLSDDFGILRILQVSSNDAGIFECSIRNRLNEVIGEYRWRLTVKAGSKPDFSLRPSDQLNLEMGSTLIADCHAVGSPKPLINWLRNSDDVNAFLDNPLNDDPRVSISPETGRLEIRNLRESDAGIYTCTAFNDLDEASTIMRVTIRAKPSAPVPLLRPAPSSTTTTLPPLVGPAFFEQSAKANLRSSKIEAQDAQDRSFEFVTVVPATTKQPFRPPSPLRPPNLQSPIPASQPIISQPRPLVSPPRQKAPLKDSDVIDVVNRVRNEISVARKETERNFADTVGHRTAQDLQAILRQPDEQGIALSEASEIYERSLALIEDQLAAGSLNYPPDSAGSSSIMATHFLSQAHLKLIANLSGCLPHRQHVNIKCSSSSTCFHAKYRTADGTCNNLRNPTWGASHMPYVRILSPIYENGLGEPVGWNENKVYNGFKLPSARLVSSRLLATSRPQPHKKYTHMLMQWGQFIDHDFTFTPQTASSVAYGTNQRCNDTCSNVAPCFPIQVPQNDHRIKRHKCIGITRSAATCGTGTTSLLVNYVYPREQFNQITAYIDASNVYGSTNEQMDEIRDKDNTGYLLRVGPKSRHGDQHLLPFDSNNQVDCQIDQSRASVPCFLAGDHRANEQLGLLSMHTIWMREHNRIAAILREINPEWTPETVFQEARKIVGAAMQHITYSTWLPKILGPVGMQQLGPYRGYNDSVQADMYNEFAAAAFRFGHSLVMPTIFRFDENLQPLKSGHLPLHEAFFAPYRLIDDEGGVDAVLRGLFGHSAKHFEPGSVMNTELTDRLFALAHELALDLGGFNIQRGRDHALRGYTAYRKWCGFGQVITWIDLRADITNEKVLQILQDLYGHPDNIDLFAGLVSEDPIEGSIIGPTLMCILVDQFRRLRDGDRFWYEKPGVFSELQLYQIRQANLARVICDNSDNITRIQPDVFSLAPSAADYVKCSVLPGIDINYWRDCCFASGHCIAKSEIAILYSLRENPRRFGSETGVPDASGSSASAFLRSSADNLLIPQPRNLRLDPVVYDEIEQSTTDSTTSTSAGSTKYTYGKRKHHHNTKEEKKCCHDGLAEAIAELKGEVEILRREVAEFKARVRYRNSVRKVYNYSNYNTPAETRTTMHDDVKS